MAARIAKRPFKVVLDGAAEAYRMIEPIREAEVPVLLHATMIRAWGDARNLALDTASRLAEAGIPLMKVGGLSMMVPPLTADEPEPDEAT